MNIKEMRKSRGETQAEAAKGVGISRFWYIDIELGRKTPSVKTAKKIAGYYGIDWKQLFE